MRRYVGEFTQVDERAVPKIFDGWGYIPLEPVSLAQRPEPESANVGGEHVEIVPTSVNKSRRNAL